jgi:RHS repeat-associated protein
VTWLATTAGAVTAALRYDPWGTPRAAVPSGYTPFRFQGSWFDDTTSLAWVVTRWYAPALGRFISEDTLLGEPIDPPSRHLYAYGAGEPVGRWDPDGMFWYRVKAGDTLSALGSRYLRGTADRHWIYMQNRRLLTSTSIRAGWCLWIPDLKRHSTSITGLRQS